MKALKKAAEFVVRALWFASVTGFLVWLAASVWSKALLAMGVIA